MRKPDFESVSIINAYLTPLAIILVLLAVVFSKPYGTVLYWSIALLGAGLVNNLVTASFLKDKQPLLYFRMCLNILINIILVYLLIGYWGPIWFLLLTTPIATAVYSTRIRTLFTSLAMSLVLVLIYAVRGVSSAQAWGQAASRIVLIVILSLFINSLVSRCFRT
jgi:hypothetical protein